VVQPLNVSLRNILRKEDVEGCREGNMLLLCAAVLR
jgi:hypothetical protein